MVPYILILKETATMFVHTHLCQLSCSLSLHSFGPF